MSSPSENVKELKSIMDDVCRNTQQLRLRNGIGKGPILNRLKTENDILTVNIAKMKRIIDLLNELTQDLSNTPDEELQQISEHPIKDYGKWEK